MFWDINFVTPDYLAGVADFIIVEHIKKMVSPTDDEGVKEWHNRVIQLLETRSPYAEVVPKLLQEIFHWIEHIEQQMRDFIENQRFTCT